MRGNKLRIAMILIVAGIILMAGGIYIGYGRQNGYRPKKAIISEINPNRTTGGNRHPSVQVRYSVGGMQYMTYLNSYSSSYKEGGEITIYYNPDNPSEIKSDMRKPGFFIALAGLIAVIAGPVLLLGNGRNFAKNG
ncbi:MAG: DUF3592 domain-containing protein [Lachnospiraceae bacterium]|nr:DUF3592 domain-containing protein [Lachnospiraceae bacterium]